jgi:23S rRNA (cytidine1920-2'-O)/16S rRNA (cytidine1409-2'-O)-methyltransferase
MDKKTETRGFAPKEKLKYVSRGGLKLEYALKYFSVDVRDKICLDVGSSTGGFTDCLLQHGAKKVYAVDVGKGLLDWKLRNDPRVSVCEKTNFKYFLPELLDEKPDLVTVDVSFISLNKIFPKVKDILSPGGVVFALIKPQFEAERKDVKKGVVQNEVVRQEVVEKVEAFAKEAGFDIDGTATSPVRCPKGNIECFLYMRG